MENQDITLKNLLIVAFLILGLFSWTKIDFSFSFERVKKLQSPLSFERSPTALKNKVQKVVVQKNSNFEYKPDLNVFDSKRLEDPGQNAQEIQRQDAMAPSEPAKVNEFETTRNEITVLMAAGKSEEALELARTRFEEKIINSSEVAYMGYLQDFIMQSTHDPEEQYSLTYSSIKSAQDENVRKQLVQKFSIYQPDLAEEMKHEIKAAGISI